MAIEIWNTQEAGPGLLERLGMQEPNRGGMGTKITLWLLFAKNLSRDVFVGCLEDLSQSEVTKFKFIQHFLKLL